VQERFAMHVVFVCRLIEHIGKDLLTLSRLCQIDSKDGREQGYGEFESSSEILGRRITCCLAPLFSKCSTRFPVCFPTETPFWAFRSKVFITALQENIHIDGYIHTHAGFPITATFRLILIISSSRLNILRGASRRRNHH
jgi:hypothetical protein